MAVKRALKISSRILLLLIAWGTLSIFIPRKWFGTNTCEDVEIMVKSNGYHTGIILPFKTEVMGWDSIFPFAYDSKYIEFGWGDSAFYMASEVDAGMVFNALFMTTPTVMHVVGVPSDPVDFFKHAEIKRVKICSENYLKLTQHILNSFERDDNLFQYIKKGYYKTSAFYKATGTYGGLNTCNTWVAEGLRLADINTPVWSGLANAVMFHLPDE